jgi:hypothetical protein
MYSTRPSLWRRKGDLCFNCLLFSQMTDCPVAGARWAGRDHWLTLKRLGDDVVTPPLRESCCCALRVAAVPCKAGGEWGLTQATSDVSTLGQSCLVVLHLSCVLAALTTLICASPPQFDDAAGASIKCTNPEGRTNEATTRCLMALHTLAGTCACKMVSVCLEFLFHGWLKAPCALIPSALLVCLAAACPP